MNLRTPIFGAYLFVTIAVSAQRKEITFEVVLNDQKIGTLHALEERIDNNKYYRDIKTNTDAKIIIVAVHVESEVSSTHENEIMIKGTAYRHANRGTEDVHALVTRVGEKRYRCERNGGVSHIENREIYFSVADFYFKEPKGVKEVFSTMYTEFLPLSLVAPGKYMVVTPDNKNAYYTYVEGRLVTIEVHTSLGMVKSSLL